MRVATKYHNKVIKPSESENNFGNNFFKTDNESVTELLKSSVIYGANASGKTNLIKALYVFNFVVYQEKKRSRGDSIVDYDPFAFDEKYRTKPTEFEIDFITQNKRYVYGFSYDKKKIHHEKLEFYEGNKKVLIYELKLDEKNNLKENFTEYFQGKKDRALDIFKNTENNLFLPLNINEDGNKFLNPIYDWVAEKLFIENDHTSFSRTAKWIQSDPNNKKNALELLRKIDVGVNDLEVETIDRKLPKQIIEDQTFPEELKLELKTEYVVRFKTLSGHTLKKSQISLGTTAVFSLCSVILPILESGGVLFFDELERSLHPDVFIQIVRMFHDPKINKGNGQIIFTAHNDILLDKEYKILRRDQVWFASKTNKTQTTELYSLVAFGAKKRDNIVELYRNHAYGARPILKEFRW